jgi:hypothetical protein
MKSRLIAAYGRKGCRRVYRCQHRTTPDTRRLTSNSPAITPCLRTGPSTRIGRRGRRRRLSSAIMLQNTELTTAPVALFVRPTPMRNPPSIPYMQYRSDTRLETVPHWDRDVKLDARANHYREHNVRHENSQNRRHATQNRPLYPH